MLTEVMRYFGLARPPVDLGFFETEPHAQLTHDLKTAITGRRLITRTAIIGSGKTVRTRRLREELEREGRVIVSRALSLENAKISVPLLVGALFYDLSSGTARPSGRTPFASTMRTISTTRPSPRSDGGNRRPDDRVRVWRPARAAATGPGDW